MASQLRLARRDEFRIPPPPEASALRSYSLLLRFDDPSAFFQPRHVRRCSKQLVCLIATAATAAAKRVKELVDSLVRRVLRRRQATPPDGFG